MKGFGRGGRARLWGWCLPALSLAIMMISCSRPTGLNSDNAVLANQHPAPFQDDGGAARSGPDGSSEPGKTPGESGLPFGDAGDLPAGTLLTVQLRNATLGMDAASGGTFTAIIDQAVLVEGKTLLPRGIRVAGRVESAGESQVNRDRAYLRLTLSTVDLDGHEIPVQASSLFVKNHAADSRTTPGSLDLGSGRRLTFRLTEPCSIPDTH